MVQVLHHGNRKTKKALTLLETVIGLSVLVIVSLAAVSLAVYSTTSFQTAKIKRFFRHEVNALAEYFISYDDASDFAKAVSDYNGKTVTRGTDTVFYYTGAFELTDDVEHGAYKLVLDFTGETELTITAAHRDDAEILKRSAAR